MTHIQPEEADKNLLDYVLIVLNRKELIIKATLLGVCAAAVYSLFVPAVYIAETKILPPHGGNSSMSSLMVSQMGFSPAALGLKNTNELYISLFRTRGVIDYVIDKCGLVNIYRGKSKEKIRELTSAGLVVRDDKKSGIITLGFKYRNPQKAADIANAFVEGLQGFNNNLAVTEAGQRRLFFEEQLKSARENLIRSEESLKFFQQRTGTIKIDDEAKAVIGTVAEMRAKISAKEVQLRVMKSYATTENPDLQRLQAETLAFKEELKKMESRSSPDDTVPTVGKMSNLGTEYIRRMREFRYNEALYEILMKQFEAAKLDESRDAALVQIIEKAEAPETRVAPQRRKMVLNAGIVSFLISIVFVLLAHFYTETVNSPENKAAIYRLEHALDFTQLANDLKLDSIVLKIKGFIDKYGFKK